MKDKPTAELIVSLQDGRLEPIVHLDLEDMFQEVEQGLVSSLLSHFIYVKEEEAQREEAVQEEVQEEAQERIPEEKVQEEAEEMKKIGAAKIHLII